jgi:flagellar assembly factor FliW
VKSKLVTKQFGELEFDESIVYHFPNGIPGFEELHNFIIIDDQDTEPLRWLLSTDDSNVGLALLEASLVAPEIYKELSAEDGSTTAFVVVVLRRDPEPITANLKAPIVLNHAAKSGKQIVLNSDRYSTEYKIN